MRIWLILLKTPDPLNLSNFRYLQNGNILAARTFVKHFTSSFTSKYPSFTTPGSNALAVGSGDEIIVTSDPVLNFAQVAVRLCQRAQGDRSKLMRESWVRFCGTYQSRSGILATKEIRKVSRFRRRPFLSDRITSLDFQVLNEIGELFFALPPPKGQQPNPFGDMMSALMGGGGPAPQQQRRVLSPASGPASGTTLD